MDHERIISWRESKCDERVLVLQSLTGPGDSQPRTGVTWGNSWGPGEIEPQVVFAGYDSLYRRRQGRYSSIAWTVCVRLGKSGPGGGGHPNRRSDLGEAARDLLSPTCIAIANCEGKIKKGAPSPYI